ncbi:MAG TPA: hypothetical protein VFQ96_00885 [Microbacteriaceae bacterium]|nr:hypothetical protein [Microbacteriaceae bacterium]
MVPEMPEDGKKETPTTVRRRVLTAIVAACRSGAETTLRYALGWPPSVGEWKALAELVERGLIEVGGRGIHVTAAGTTALA